MEMNEGLTGAESEYGANRHSVYAKGPFKPRHNPDEPVFYLVDPDPTHAPLADSSQSDTAEDAPVADPLPKQGHLPDEQLSPPPLDA